MLKHVQNSYKEIPKLPGEESREMTVMFFDGIVHFQFAIMFTDDRCKVMHCIPLEEINYAGVDSDEIESRVFKELIRTMKEGLNREKSHTK